VNQKPAFLRRLGILLLVGGLVAGVSTPAWAGPKDGEAKKLAESAIYEDYLNLQFDAAIAKLNQARDLCEDGCGRSVQATVYRDLGVVYFAGKEDKASALDYFKKAFQADPFVKLDEDLSSDEIKAVFEEARSAVGVPSSSSSDEGSGLTSSSATGSHNPQQSRPSKHRYPCS
jgi:tetratricopeptide (TPR) repeat protein